MLGDVFGVSHLGEVDQRFSYVTPTQGREALFDGYDTQYPLGIDEGQTRIEAQAAAEVWATTGLPFSDPDDWESFTSIHSDPPGIATDDPAVVCHAYGRGRSIYATAPLEAWSPFATVFVNLIGDLCPSFSFEADAPPVVEVMAFWQADHRRHLVNVLNFQPEQPNVPVHDVRLRVRTDGRQVRAVRLLPEGGEASFEMEGGRVAFTSPPVDVLRMFAVEYA